MRCNLIFVIFENIRLLNLIQIEPAGSSELHLCSPSLNEATSSISHTPKSEPDQSLPNLIQSQDSPPAVPSLAATARDAPEQLIHEDSPSAGRSASNNNQQTLRKPKDADSTKERRTVSSIPNKNDSPDLDNQHEVQVLRERSSLDKSMTEQQTTKENETHEKQTEPQLPLKSAIHKDAETPRVSPSPAKQLNPPDSEPSSDPTPELKTKSIKSPSYLPQSPKVLIHVIFSLLLFFFFLIYKAIFFIV